jgi:hypothetical protein
VERSSRSNGSGFIKRNRQTPRITLSAIKAGVRWNGFGVTGRKKTKKPEQHKAALVFGKLLAADQPPYGHLLAIPVAVSVTIAVAIAVAIAIAIAVAVAFAVAPEVGPGF